MWSRSGDGASFTSSLVEDSISEANTQCAVQGNGGIERGEFNSVRELDSVCLPHVFAYEVNPISI